ncbi:hypothetical protein GCM10027404_21490 [Arthrobacter tumbae]|uniref:hypothetical protein n=1 Tax=Arthrobacter tumbae TaxID=163874 RepID=UPI0019566C05|nr:hypothetical protein [Arthrobacter tumbae]MBM7781195.1 hypothetical protein [Arthrobacter tumbae]
MTDNAAESNHAHDDDPREAVLEPDPRAGDAENIRDEQGTHAAGAVPAAFVGGDQPGDKPEEAADNSGHWDEMGRENPAREPGNEES